MSTMRQLKDETESAFARRLLESAAADRSAEGAHARALEGLGLGAGGVLAAGSVAKAAAGGSSAAAGAGGTLTVAASASTKVGALVLAKWAGIGVVAGTLMVGTAGYIDRRSTEGASMSQLGADHRPGGAPPISPGDRIAGARPAAPHALPVDPREAARPTQGAEVTASGSSRAPTRQNLGAAADLGSPAPTNAFGEPAASGASGGAQPDPGTMAQLAILSRARTALSAHDPAAALALLDDFHRRYPASPLAEEAAVLRIEVLAGASRWTEASVLGNEFLRTHPASAYAQRVRSVLKIP
jgi:hypothetical protein